MHKLCILAYAGVLRLYWCCACWEELAAASGPTCSGKTELLAELAQLHRQKLLTVVVQPETEPTELLGRLALLMVADSGLFHAPRATGDCTMVAPQFWEFIGNALKALPEDAIQRLWHDLSAAVCVH